MKRSTPIAVAAVAAVVLLALAPAAALLGRDGDDADADDPATLRERAIAAAHDVTFREISLALPEGLDTDAWRFERTDLDGDGVAELLLIVRGGDPTLVVWRASADGAGFDAEPALVRPLPEGATLVDLADASVLGRASLLALTRDALIAIPLVLPPRGDGAPPAGSAMEPVQLARVASPVPDGYEGDARLLRDLDGDGRREVVVPTRRGFTVLTPDGAGALRDAWDVAVVREVEIDLGPDDPDLMGRPAGKDRIRFRSVVHDVEPRDVDGDGDRDLLVRDEARAFLYRREDGGAIRRRPTAVVDFARHLDDVPPVEVFGQKLDMASLQMTIRDLDGDGVLDFVANAAGAGRVVVVRGRRDLRTPSVPDQVIRISGIPIVSTLDFDIDQDGRHDLLVVRLPELSMLSVLGIIIRGRLEIDLMGFDQRAPGELPAPFPSEPDRIGTLAIDFSVSRVLELVERVKNDQEAIADLKRLGAGAKGAADIDGDGAKDFILVAAEDGKAVAKIFVMRDPGNLELIFELLGPLIDDIKRILGGERGEKAEVVYTIEELYEKLAAAVRRIVEEVDAGTGAVKVDLGIPIAPDLTEDEADAALERALKLSDLSDELDEVEDPERRKAIEAEIAALRATDDPTDGVYELDDIEIESADIDGDGRDDLLILPLEDGDPLRVLLSKRRG